MAHMVTFLKLMNNKTWKAVVKRWTPPKTNDEDNTKTVKHEKDLIMAEDKETLVNW